MLDTRLRFVRRLIYAAILLIGIAIALSQFTGVSKLAASLLASGAIAAAIIGFAARQTLANVVAGIMLAITQPLRVGDWVTFEGNYGVVEDVRLNYTVLRTASDERVVIPNERLAAGHPAQRHARLGRVGARRVVWLPPEADVERALAALRGRDRAGVERRRGHARGRAPGGRRRPGAAAATGPARRPSCARNACKRLRRRACWRGNPGRRRTRQGYTRSFALVMERALEMSRRATGADAGPRSPSEQGLPRAHGRAGAGRRSAASPRSAR